jgi:hypothetical protein
VLRTKFSNSPYVVVKPLWVTTLIKRLADGFITLYSNNDLKRYDKTSPLFNTLPPEITKVLLNDFSDFITTDFTEITKYDPFDIPDGVELFNAENITKAPERNLPPLNDEEEDDDYTEALKALDNENLEKDVENLDNVPIRNDLLTDGNALDTGEITEDEDNDLITDDEDEESDEDETDPDKGTKRLRNRNVRFDLTPNRRK